MDVTDIVLQNALVPLRGSLDWRSTKSEIVDRLRDANTSLVPTDPSLLRGEHVIVRTLERDVPFIGDVEAYRTRLNEVDSLLQRLRRSKRRFDKTMAILDLMINERMGRLPKFDVSYSVMNENVFTIKRPRRRLRGMGPDEGITFRIMGLKAAWEEILVLKNLKWNETRINPAINSYITRLGPAIQKFRETNPELESLRKMGKPKLVFEKLYF